IYDPNPAPFDATHQLPYRNVSDALTFLDGVGDRPFFLWLSFAEPHNPYQVPAPYYDMFPPEALPPAHVGVENLAGKPYAYEHTRAMWEKLMGDRLDSSVERSRSNYMGMLRLMDDQIARLDAGLQARGLGENTHLIFLSDHGDFVGEYGMMRKGPQLAEPLCRIPLVWRGPGIARKQGASHAFVNIVDILPTLCDLASLPCPKGVEGRSLSPVLRGESEQVAEDSYSEIGFGGLFWGPQDDGLTPEAEGALRTEGMPLVGFDCLNTWTQCGFSRSLWWENWKLVLDMNGSIQLYDIQADPFETNNLAGDAAHAAVRSGLLRRLIMRMQSIQRD
nr:sulfatase-like hydrolase/transferase [Clostridia bacterium]